MRDDLENPPPRRRTVAIVDDQELNRRVYRKVLENASFDVDVVEGRDGREAIELRFGAPAPVAMIINGRMAGMDGLQACVEIRRMEAEQDLPRCR